MAKTKATTSTTHSMAMLWTLTARCPLEARATQAEPASQAVCWRARH